MASEAEEQGPGARNTTLKTCEGESIGQVTLQFAERVRTDGKGRLEDGSLIYQACECIQGIESNETFNRSQANNETENRNETNPSLK